MEEKLTFLAEQRERELSRCEAFAREVEEAMEREISAQLGSYHCSASESPAFDGESPHPASLTASGMPVRRSDADCPASLPSEQFAGSRALTNGEMPAHTACGSHHLLHARASSFPELQHLGGQLHLAVTADERSPVLWRRTRSATDTADSVAPAWLADQSYYASALPSRFHRCNRDRRTRKGAPGKTVHSRTARRTITGSDASRMAMRQPHSQKVESV